MKRSSISLLSALLLSLFFLQACATSNSPDSAPPEVSAAKQELENLVFDNSFDSPEYYQQVAEAVKSIQSRMLLTKARVNRDAQLCEQIDTEKLREQCKDEVLYQDAVAEKDSKRCDAIKDEVQAENCVQQIIFLEAVEAKDQGACNKISNATLKESCKNNVLFIEASETRNKNLCEKITDGRQQRTCLQNIDTLEAVRESVEE